MSTCASCGRDCLPETSFCADCGSPLGGARPVGERRQLTVMFCDLVASTELAHRLDPEVLGEVMHAYQASCVEAIERYEGHVAQLLGDGILVYFGYPKAHEEDALRAVSAALDILGALPRLSRRLAERVPILRERPLQARVALHTGPVVIDEFGGADRPVRLALGDTVNIAARVLGVAKPGEVVISGATRHLVEGVVVLDDLGERTLRGISEPVALYRVVGPNPTADERGAWPSSRAPLVGRESEFALLQESWDEAKQGKGRAVLLSGEAGIGKSRLVQSFAEQTADQPRFSYECHCSPFRTHSAFHPMLVTFAHGLGFAADDPPEAKVSKLEGALEQAGLEPALVLPLVAVLLSLPLPEEYRSVALSPEARRHRTFDFLIAWLTQVTKQRPVLLIVEDLQWIDASTLELLELFLERIHDLPVLALLTARTEFEQSWEACASVLKRELGPLPEPQVAIMVEAVAGDSPLPAEIVAEVVARADGVPLFVEELTQEILEQYAFDLDQSPKEAKAGVSIPSTLQGSLMARLDRLGPTKEVAQQAAVLGREFSLELLEAISPLDDASLRDELGQLEAARVIHPGRGQSTFVFRHALIQEAAYQSLLRSRRRELHERIANALAERFPGRTAAEPEVIAWHCEMAGRIAEAVSHHQRAAERAMHASAQPEAIGHLAKALDLLATLPESLERNRRELALRVALGVPLIEAKGYGNPEVEQTHRRARELCREVGEGPELYQALGGIYLFHTARAELKPAADLAAELLELGESEGDPFVRQWGHFFSAPPHYYRGEFAAAVDHVERAMALQGSGRRPDWFVHEHDADVSARVYAAMALWNLGNGAQAAARMQEAVELGSESPHPWNHAFALGFAALFHHMCREPGRVLERAEEAVEVSAAQGFPVWLGIGTLLKGWARAQAGEGTIDEVVRSLGQSSATGTRIEGPRVLGLLAEIYHALGRGPQAIHALDSALALSREKECFYWDAELHRLKGEELIAQQAAPEEVEDCFRRALAVAKRQQAKSLALRAAVSLCRLQQRQGEPADGAAMLGELYGAFTEARDTPDLQDASALLSELRVSRSAFIPSSA